MRHHEIKKLFAASACCAVLLSGYTSCWSATSSPAPEKSISTTWKLRASAATKKLTKPGLDACDKAIERGFEDFIESNSKNGHKFQIKIEINEKSFTATYIYRENHLDAFVLSPLPSRWMAVQRPDSKTLNVLVVDSKCSLNLCTNDPFSENACKDNSDF